jgi:hypothetical protein
MTAHTAGRTAQGGTIAARSFMAAVLLATAAPAYTQEPLELRLGSVVSGTLAAGGPAMTGEGPFRVHRLEAREGQRLLLTLQSPDFDAYLSVLRAVGGVTELLAATDAGEGVRARLRWAAPAGGTYLVLAHAADPGSSGRYTLLVEEAPLARPAAPQPIRAGEPVRGTLHGSSGILEDEGSDVHYDLYVFDARAGQQFLITLVSGHFDAFLEFGPLAGPAIDVTHYNDDGAGDLNARLRVSIPADGRYGIIARTLGPDEVGSYVLTMREVAGATPRRLAAGSTVESTLVDDDYEEWLYSGSAGERVRVRMQSGSFDTVLQIGMMRDGQFHPLADNDDESDESTDSLLEFPLPENGQYVIRAGAFRPGTAGSYTLRLDSLRR